jgi:hypothetical protein
MPISPGQADVLRAIASTANRLVELGTFDANVYDADVYREGLECDGFPFLDDLLAVYRELSGHLPCEERGGAS